MSNKPKIFNIKGLSDDLQAVFRKMAIDSGKTHKELMSDLLSGKTLIEGKIDTEAVNKLSECEKRIKDLEEQLTDKQHDLEALFDSLQEQKSQNHILNQAIDDLKSNPAGIILSGHQFVFEPALIQRNMQRCISQMIRKGKLNRHEPNILQSFTEKAITYFIKNEYPEVL